MKDEQIPGQMTIFDIVKPEQPKKQQQNCITCTHYHTIVDAYTCEPIEKRCCPGDVFSYSVSNPEHHYCELWEQGIMYEEDGDA